MLHSGAGFAPFLWADRPWSLRFDDFRKEKPKTGYSIVKLSDSIDKPADVAELVDALDLGSSVLVT
jgi:hypothetical protein